MKLLQLATAILFFAILSEKIQAQDLYLKATSTQQIITGGANTTSISTVRDAHGGPQPVMTNYAEVTSMGFDTEQTLNLVSQSGPAAGVVAFKPLTIRKLGDISSTKFFLSQCRGDLMDLEIIKVGLDGSANRQVMYKFILRDAAVKTITTDIGSDCNCSQETISFEYRKLEIYSYTIDNAGRVSRGEAVGWNLVTNTRISL